MCLQRDNRVQLILGKNFTMLPDISTRKLRQLVVRTPPKKRGVSMKLHMLEMNGQSKRDPHPAYLGQPVVRFCPCNVGPPMTKLRLNAVSRGRYGIICLFDGVSSVVPILKKKFGYPPTAVILAECDLSLRQLVCTEFYEKSDTTTRTQRGSLNHGNPVATNPNAKTVKQVKSQVHNECKTQ